MRNDVRRSARGVLRGVPVILLALLLLAPAATVWAQDGDEGRAAADDNGNGSAEVAEPVEEKDAGDAERELGPLVNQPLPDPFAIPERSTFGRFRITGDVQLALRTVNVDGSENRYRKDFGFQDGVVLSNSKLTFTPAGDDPASWFDRLEIWGDGYSFDGDKNDKYRSWGLSGNKSGSYRFRVDNRTVNYFWNSAANHHSWNTDRTLTNAELVVTPITGLEISGTYRRFRDTGPSVTTRDVSRNEFELEQPIDRKGTTWGLGGRYRIDRTVFFLKQDWKKFEDNGGYRSVGFNPGLEPGGASLDLLTQREIREMDAPMTYGGVQTGFADGRVRLAADFFYSKQDMVARYDRVWEGLNFQQRETVEELDVTGDVERKVKHGNVQLLWSPNEHFTFSGKYRRRGWEQGGVQDRTSRVAQGGGDFVESAETNLSAYDITLDQFLFGAEWAPSGVGSIYGEFGTGTRKQDFSINGDGTEREDTKVTSFTLRGRLRPARSFDMEASYARGDLDNTFSRVEPTTRDGVRVKLRWRPSMAWQVTGTVNYDKNKSERSEAELKTDGFALNVAYTGSPGRYVYAGYTRLGYDLSVPTRFPVFFSRTDFVILYDHSENVWTLGGEYAISTPFALYANLNYVDSSGSEEGLGENGATSRIQLPLTYYDIWIGVRYTLNMGVFIDAYGRFMEYQDDSVLLSSQDSYRSDMFVLGLGYRF